MCALRGLPPVCARMRTMSLLKLTLLLLVYVSLDFSNPMMPGAVSFGSDASVKGYQADRVREADVVAPHLPAAMPQRLTPARASVMVSPRSVREAPLVWQVLFRRAYPSLSAPVDSSEDH